MLECRTYNYIEFFPCDTLYIIDFVIMNDKKWAKLLWISLTSRIWWNFHDFSNQIFCHSSILTNFATYFTGYNFNWWSFYRWIFSETYLISVYYTVWHRNECVYLSALNWKCKYISSFFQEECWKWVFYKTPLLI